ncbi:FUSC family protein [Streptomyces bauhiniae]
MAFAITAEGTPALTDVLPLTALTALGAAIAWLVCLPNSLQPQRLQRLALADALECFARALEAAGPIETSKARHQAVVAALRAYRALDDPDDGDGVLGLTRRAPGRPATTGYSADYVWAPLTTDTLLEPHTTDNAPAPPEPRPPTPPAPAAHADGNRPRPRGRRRSQAATFLPTTVRTFVGTTIGLLPASAVLVLHPGPVAIICLIIVFEFFLEYVVARNYGLGVVFLTPLALLLGELSAPVSASRLLHDRVIGIGVSVGLVCALLLVHGRAAVRMREALHLCTVVSGQAEHALHGTAGRRRVAQVQLAASAVERYEAKEAASGELRPTGVDPAAVAAAEHRAYDLLGRLSRAVLADDRARRGRARRRPGAARPS